MLVPERLARRAMGELRYLSNRFAPGDESRRLLVVGSGQYAFRGYILESLHRAGYPVTLVTDTAPTWEKQFVNDIVQADFSRPTEVVTKVIRSHGQRPARGCLTYVERNVPLTSELSRALGLRFYGPEVAERVRDKSRMREQLRAAGLRTPRFELCGGNVRAAAERVGLPAVFKPVKGEGSIHVLKLTDEASLAEAEALLQKSREDARWGYGADYVVESYIEGDEFSVESVVAKGQIFHVAVTDKYKSAEPYFEEIGHCVPSSRPPEVTSRLMDEASAAIKALGLDNCAVHTEMKLDGQGPTIIEVGGRLGGDRIPYLVRLATGVDMASAAADAALGQKVDAVPGPHGYASVGFFVPTRQEVQRSALTHKPQLPGLVNFDFWGEPGQKVSPPPQQFMTRLGYAIATAASYDESRRILDVTRQMVEEQTGLSLLPLG